MSRYLEGLGYVGFGISSLPDWRRFVNDVLGAELKPGYVPGTSLIRLDDKDYRFILVEDGTDDVSFVGWQVKDDAALDKFADHLKTLGVAFTWATDTELAVRGVSRMLAFHDPDSTRHEAFTGMPQATTEFVSDKIQTHYVTSAGGLGHVVFGAKHYAECLAFAKEVLGAGASDVISEEFGPGRVLNVTFFHVNQRHHSIAFADMSGPKRMHHFMLEVSGMTDVGHTRDRHIKAGLSIAQDIGQHPNDKMISYYGAVPSGFLMEFGWGGVQVDPETWQVGHYDKISEWGHRPLPAVA